MLSDSISIAVLPPPEPPPPVERQLTLWMVGDRLEYRDAESSNPTPPNPTQVWRANVRPVYLQNDSWALPEIPTQLQVFLNGLCMTPILDYILSNNVISFAESWGPDAIVNCFYMV